MAIKGINCRWSTPAATSPATVPAIRAVNRIRRNIPAQCRWSVAGKGEGVADIVCRVVERRRPGEPDAVDDENPEQDRGQRGNCSTEGRYRKAAGDRVKHGALNPGRWRRNVTGFPTGG